MDRLVSAGGLQIVTELQVKTIQNIEDNMMRYLVGQCIWGGATLALYSDRILGALCEPNINGLDIQYRQVEHLCAGA